MRKTQKIYYSYLKLREDKNICQDSPEEVSFLVEILLGVNISVNK